MNLKSEYKRLFEGKQRSNDKSLLREAVELQPVQYSDAGLERVYGKDEIQVGVQGNKFFVSDKRYSKGRPIHLTKLDFSYVGMSSRLYAIYLYDHNSRNWTIKISGHRSDEVWNTMAMSAGFKNGREAIQKCNIKVESTEFDVS
jgi:hypothetical protein